MLSERVQRQVDRLLDGAEEAIWLRDWELVPANAQDGWDTRDTLT